MKKLTIILSLLLFVGVANAQIQKGDVQVGGSASITTSKTGDNKTNFFSFTPRAGFFVSDNTSLGLTAGFSSLTRDVFQAGSGNTVEQTTNQFQIGVYSRFHKSLADNFYIYLQPSIALGSGKSETDGSETSSSDSFNVQLMPGITYFMSNRFALEMSIGNLNYSSNKTDLSGTEQTNNNFNLNLSFSSIGLGVSYYIK